MSLPKPRKKKPGSGSWDHPLGDFTEALGLGMFLPELGGEPTGQAEPLEHALDCGILLPSFVVLLRELDWEPGKFRNSHHMADLGSCCTQ